MATATTGRRITRDDLQAAYAQVLGEGEATARSAMPQAVAVAGVVALVALTVVYIFGKRRGRKQDAITIRRA
jgi:hypothetical protein